MSAFGGCTGKPRYTAFPDDLKLNTLFISPSIMRILQKLCMGQMDFGCLPNSLGDRDLNPDTQIQSLMSYHWTIPQGHTKRMSFDKLCNLKGGNASHQTFKRHSQSIYKIHAILSSIILIHGQFFAKYSNALLIRLVHSSRPINSIISNNGGPPVTPEIANLKG